MLPANRIITHLFVILAILTVPLLVVRGSGGGIEGKVTDPKGAVVVDAEVTVSDDRPDIFQQRCFDGGL